MILAVEITASADAVLLSTEVLFCPHVFRTCMLTLLIPGHARVTWHLDIDGGVDISESDSGKTRR